MKAGSLEQGLTLLLGAVVVVAILAGGCGTSGSETELAANELGAQPSSFAGLSRCDPDAPRPAAPEDWYRAEPRYVGNEQPRDDVVGWAEHQPGFQSVWIDRDHNGWITLAFNRPVEEIQRDLEARFPDAGVVAVEVEWEMDHLWRLQSRVLEALQETGLAAAVSASATSGYVEVNFGILDDTAASVLEPLTGEPICVTGRDRAESRVGPQADGGEGWRLLAAEGSAQHRRGDREPAQLAGPPPTPGGIELGNRIELATTPGQYGASWGAALSAVDGGLSAGMVQPEVDFDNEIVVLANLLESGSCPQLIFGIEVEGPSVEVVTGVSDEKVTCTDDGNPLTWAVAIERSVLPAGPFTLKSLAGWREPIELGVDVDLSQPGAEVADTATIAARGALAPWATPDPRPTAPPSQVLPTPLPAQKRSPFPDALEPGFARPMAVHRDCFSALGPLNGYVWTPINPELRAAGPPDAWLSTEVDGELQLELLLSDASTEGPTLDIRAGGRTERFKITDTEPAC